MRVAVLPVTEARGASFGEEALYSTLWIPIDDRCALNFCTKHAHLVVPDGDFIYTSDSRTSFNEVQYPTVVGASNSLCRKVRTAFLLQLAAWRGCG